MESKNPASYLTAVLEGNENMIRKKAAELVEERL